MNRLLASTAALGALFTAVVALSTACTSPALTCVPECRSGYVCVRGGCVSACNPPCGAGEVCAGSGTSAACVRADASLPDATDGAPLDAPSNPDAPATDAPTPTDAPAPGMDAPAPSDAPATDAPTPSDGPAADAPPPCGHAGQPCCGSPAFFCQPGNLCASGTCRAIVATPGECSRPADCAAGQLCAGPQACGDHECFHCIAAADAGVGTGAFGAACTTASMCASGVCLRGHCTTACALGTTGDADCAREASGYLCSQVVYTTGPTGMTTTTAIGFCRRACVRNADCTAPETCIPQLNEATDHMDWVCGVSGATGAAGAPCTDGSMCQAFICIPSGSGTSGNCTAACAADTDCPPAAPFCSNLLFLRPSGATQPGRGCTVTRM